ncbi:hypothetical protein HGRIS_002990 [Hohenbuehelia grisea]|uniref:Uncharacterized protein n=1 Tax=Hohenbuehelia grisea TaxID=104357 RepID=A0ABR3JNH7_9AGAR
MSDLVQSLNQLLHALDLPFILESPQDLTPSLLCATLACILRKPLSDFATGHGVSHNVSFDDTISILTEMSQSNSVGGTNIAPRVQQMKVFIGVLEHDVFKTDVGLSDVDPRRLAQGAWDEVVFVGELLVCLGRKLGWISGLRTPYVSSHWDDLPAEPSLLSVWHDGRQTREAAPSPATAASDLARSVSTSDSATLTSVPLQPTLPLPFSEDGSLTPRCIHEINIDPATFSADRPSSHANSLRSSSSPQLSPAYHAQLEERDPGNPWSAGMSDIIPRIVSCSCDDAPFPHPRPATPPHGITSPPGSLLLSTSRSSPKPPTLPPVRYDGYISLVDEESELSAFEEMRSLMSSHSSSQTGSLDVGPGHRRRLRPSPPRRGVEIRPSVSVTPPFDRVPSQLRPPIARGWCSPSSSIHRRRTKVASRVFHDRLQLMDERAVLHSHIATSLAPEQGGRPLV